MVWSNDFPGYPYIRAQGYTLGRPDGPPLWIVWHTMETDELPDRAENTARYFANPGDGRDVSANWCIDNNSAVQSVDEDSSAWTVGNRPGNYRGVNLELAGRANQSKAAWFDDYSRGLLDQAAIIAARSMTRWGIPNRWCTLADLRAKRPGHTTHRDLAVVYGGSDHTDPGPNFPRAEVVRLIAALWAGPTPTPPKEENDMPQMLVRLTSLPGVDRDQIWLAGAGLRHAVTLHSVAGTQDPGRVLAGEIAGDGPVSNGQVHAAALLGLLGNDGKVFQSPKPDDYSDEEYLSWWGVPYPPVLPGLTDEQLADIGGAAADGASRGTITLTGQLVPIKPSSGENTAAV